MSQTRKLSSRRGGALAFVLAGALLGGCTGGVMLDAHVRTPTYGVVITDAPPPPRYVEVAPRPGFVWIQGRWDYRGGRYVWMNGRWERERAGYYYAPGRWDRRGNGYVWVGGNWNRGAAREHRREVRQERRDVRKDRREDRRDHRQEKREERRDKRKNGRDHR
jgi:WXXGXW repeat (2 copies)